MDDPRCPICGTPPQAFKEGGRICSGCGSVERQRVLSQLLSRRAFGRIPFYGQRILVVAPSRSERDILADHGAPKLTSIDIRPELKPDIVANIMDMPQVASGSYGIVIASFVLCMTEDYKRAISEFNRVLEPGGFLITSDPVQDGNTIEFEGDRVSSYYGPDALAQYKVGHFRHFGRDDLARVLGELFDVKHETLNDSVTQTPVTWYVSRKRETEKARIIPPPKVSATSKVYVIPQRRKNKFISVETSILEVPPGIRNVRFGDHANGEVMCYGLGAALVSRDLGATWDVHHTPEIEGANITTAFIGSDFYLLQSVGIEGGLKEPPKGWARVFAYDKNWRFMGSSQPAKSHWHGSWSIDQRGDTIMWGTYCVNSDKYKIDYETNPAKYADTVFPNQIFRSRNRGLTWETVLELPVSHARHIHCVQHDPFAPGTWWASTGDTAQESRLYKSTDDGDTWKDMTGEMPAVYGEGGFPTFKQSAYRFTAIAITEKGLFWPTDDWLGGLNRYKPELPLKDRAGSRLIFRQRDDGADIENVAYLGYAARSMTDVGKGWIVTTEAKYPEVGIRPQVFYVPKDAPEEAEHLFDVDNYAWRGTGFSYARASRVADKGVFFSYRQQTDAFNGPTKAMKWRVEID